MHRPWTYIIGALVFAAVVGAVAYNIGLDQNAPAEPYHHHHYWFGPGFLFPLFFLTFFVFGGRGRYRCRYHERWHGEQQQQQPADPDRR